MSGSNEAIKPTKAEVDRIMECMKDDTFRDLMMDYMKSMSDPETRRQEEEYLRQVEEESKGDSATVTEFLFLKPRFVIKYKTPVNGCKVYVNLCETDKMETYSETPSKTGGDASWKIPLTVSPARQGVKPVTKPGAAEKVITIVDAALHPRTLDLADRSAKFLAMIADVTAEHVRDVLKMPGLVCDGPRTWRRLAARETAGGAGYVGSAPPQAQSYTRARRPGETGSGLGNILPGASVISVGSAGVVTSDPPPAPRPTGPPPPPTRPTPQPAPPTPRAEPTPPPARQRTAQRVHANGATFELLDSDDDGAAPPPPAARAALAPITPRHELVHSSAVGIADCINVPASVAQAAPQRAVPASLTLRVFLPAHIESAAQVALDVLPRLVTLVDADEACVDTQTALRVDLPYPVNVATSRAKFDKKTRTLTVTLPVDVAAAARDHAAALAAAAATPAAAPPPACDAGRDVVDDAPITVRSAPVGPLRDHAAEWYGKAAAYADGVKREAAAAAAADARRAGRTESEIAAAAATAAYEAVGVGARERFNRSAAAAEAAAAAAATNTDASTADDPTADDSAGAAAAASEEAARRARGAYYDLLPSWKSSRAAVADDEAAARDDLVARIARMVERAMERERRPHDGVPVVGAAGSDVLAAQQSIADALAQGAAARAPPVEATDAARHVAPPAARPGDAECSGDAVATTRDGGAEGPSTTARVSASAETVSAPAAPAAVADDTATAVRAALRDATRASGADRLLQQQAQGEAAADRMRRREARAGLVNHMIFAID